MSFKLKNIVRKSRDFISQWVVTRQVLSQGMATLLRLLSGNIPRNGKKYRYL